MENQEPNKAQNEFRFAVDNVGRVDVDDFDSLTFQELQSNRNVFQLLRAENWTDVVLVHLFL